MGGDSRTGVELQSDKCICERILEIPSSNVFVARRLALEASIPSRETITGKVLRPTDRLIVKSVKGLRVHYPVPQAKKGVATNRDSYSDMGQPMSKLRS